MLKVNVWADKASKRRSSGRAQIHVVLHFNTLNESLLAEAVCGGSQQHFLIRAELQFATLPPPKSGTLLTLTKKVVLTDSRGMEGLLPWKFIPVGSEPSEWNTCSELLQECFFIWKCQILMLDSHWFCKANVSCEEEDTFCHYSKLKEL